MNIFIAVKYCCILHGRVCVMDWADAKVDQTAWMLNAKPLTKPKNFGYSTYCLIIVIQWLKCFYTDQVEGVAKNTTSRMWLEGPTETVL